MRKLAWTWSVAVGAMMMAAWGGPVLAGQSELAAQPETIPSAADDPPPELDTAEDVVVVVGSRLGSRYARVAPSDTITRDEIDRSGATSIADALLRTSTAVAGLDDGRVLDGFSGAIGGATVGARGVGLRGLGVGATLVLLNGRRVPSYGYASSNSSSFVDLESLPASAVERVDILRSGGAALYGADAIAGVVNVVLRKTFTGFAARAQASGSGRSDAKSRSAGLAYGFGDLSEDRYNVFATLELREADALRMADRDLTRSADLRRLGGPDLRLTASPSVNFRLSDNSAGSLFGCSASLRSVDGQCLTNQNEFLDILPEQSTTAVFARGTVLAGPWTLAAELGASRNETRFSMTPSVLNVILFSPFWPFPDPPVRYPVNDFLAFGNQSYLATPFGSQRIDVTADNVRALLTASRSWADWEVEAALAWGEGQADQSGTNFVRALTFFDDLAGPTPFEFTSQPAATDAQRRRYAPGFENSSTTTMLTGDVRLRGQVAVPVLPAPVDVALGVERRRDAIDLIPDPEVVRREYINLITIDAVSDDRWITSAYAEFGLVPADWLTVQLALRHDHYSRASQAARDPGGRTTGRISMAAQPTASILIRSGYETGFRAPSLFETSLISPGTVFIPFTDPVRCPLTGAQEDCQFVPGVGGANPDLESETSRNLYIGTTIGRPQTLEFKADLFRIERDKEIGIPTAAFLVTNERTLPGRVVRQAPDLPGVPGRISRLDQRFLNLGQTSLSGIDVGFALQRPLAGGDFTVQLEASRTLSRKLRVDASSTSLDVNGYSATPKWIGLLSAGWSRDRLTVSANARYVGGYKLAADSRSPCPLSANLAAFCEVGSWTTVQASLAYAMTDDLRLSVTIDNLFDTTPPVDLLANRIYNGSLHSLVGRSFAVRAGYRF